MTSVGSMLRGVAAAAGAIVLLSACGSNTGGVSQSSGSTSASSTRLPPAPTAFNPCSIPESVMDSEQLHSRNIADSDGNGGTQWRGCRWVESDGYAVSIRATNITLQMVRDNTGFKVAEELTIAGRPALTYHDSEATDLQHDCLLNAEMKGGSLEFLLNNPASNRKTGNMNTCELAKNLANKVIPLIPASA
ncbi:hypothetical protein AWN90_07550 [Nocardia terpenica]|uniref:DUF3558 domain-containing protein n=2 Tax=Nocardia terpenica TaxID=455432 RepID=A0A164IPF2_9NOCA|nr:hypothetical protein AWN90_07550 [Nocardia terpenica]